MFKKIEFKEISFPLLLNTKIVISNSLIVYQGTNKLDITVFADSLEINIDSKTSNRNDVIADLTKNTEKNIILFNKIYQEFDSHNGSLGKISIIDINLIYIRIDVIKFNASFVIRYKNNKLDVAVSPDNIMLRQEIYKLITKNKIGKLAYFLNESYELYALIANINLNFFRFESKKNYQPVTNKKFFNISLVAYNQFIISYHLFNFQKFKNKVNSENLKIILDTKAGVIFIFDELNHSTKLEIFYNNSKTYFPNISFENNILIIKNENLENLFISLLSFWASYINLRTFYLLYKLRVENNSVSVDNISTFEIINNERNEKVNCVVNNILFNMTIRLEPVTHTYYPLAIYGNFISEKYQTMLNYFRKFQQNYYHNFYTIQFLLFELGNHPYLEIKLNNIIQNLFDHISNNKVFCLIQINYKYLVKQLLKETNITALDLKIILYDKNLSIKSKLISNNNNYTLSISNNSKEFQNEKELLTFILKTNIKDFLKLGKL